MNTTTYRHPAAPRAAAGVGMGMGGVGVGVDSGVTLGLVVVDANRPAPHAASAAGTAAGAVKQLIASH